MTCLFQRRARGPWIAANTNLWPSWRCRIDRVTLGTWYAAVQVAGFRLSLWGGPAR